MSTKRTTSDAHSSSHSPGECTAALPDDPAVLKEMIAELLATLQQMRQDQTQLREQLDRLIRRLYGSRAERFDPEQGWLFPEMATLAEDADSDNADGEADDTAEEPRPKKKRRGGGRRKLPENLKRVPREFDLTAAERACPECGVERVRIGEERSEQLDYQPASLFVVEHIRYKYACKQCQGCVTTASLPPQPIAKCLAGPGLLAQVTVSKYADHLPLHRQERILTRHDVHVPRQTMCDWMAGCAKLLRPLYERMKTELLASRVLQSDDTPVKLPSRKRGYVWFYGGDSEHPYHVFDFTESRSRDGPLTFLKSYRGYLQADALSSYHGLYQGETGRQVIEVGCWAHARRKFYDAKDSDKARAHIALAQIRRLYALEKQAKEMSDAERCALRQEQALPILAEFRSWLGEQVDQVLPKSAMGEALTYALNQWQALCRYTEAGYLPIDNNAAERALRAIAIGRKNWLFYGSTNGGQTAAVLCSFTSTCARVGVEPFAYLRDVYTRLPSHPADQLAELLPDRWQPAPTADTESS